MRIHAAEDEERFTQATEYTDSKNKNIIELLKEMKFEKKISEISLGMNNPDYHLKFIDKFC